MEGYESKRERGRVRRGETKKVGGYESKRERGRVRRGETKKVGG